jgi:hypothetical protein
VNVCGADAFPCESVAVQLTMVVPAGNVAPDGCEQVGVTGPSTTSIAVAVYVTTAPAVDVAAATIAPGTLSTGGVVSATTTTKLAGGLLLPCASVAVQLTVVEPSGKVAPDGMEQFGVTGPSTTSFAVAVYVTTAPVGDVASTVIGPGTVSVGAVVSETTTTKLALRVFWCESVTVQSTVVEPTGKVEPDAFEQDGASAPSTASVADTAKSTAAPAGEVASFVIGPGTVSCGAVLSETTTANVSLPTFPWKSVAVQPIVVEPSAKDEPGAGVHACDTTASSGSVALNV